MQFQAQHKYRVPLQHIHSNPNNVYPQNMDNFHCSDYYKISNENMDPSQKRVCHASKSGVNNNDNIHALNTVQSNAYNLDNPDPHKSNLYVRRAVTQQINIKQNASIRQLSIDVSQCNHHQNGLHSANSFTTSNDNLLLSSASSMNSSCIANGYDSISKPSKQSKQTKQSKHSKIVKKKKNKKSSSGSLLKKLSNLVSNRRNIKYVKDEDGEQIVEAMDVEQEENDNDNNNDNDNDNEDQDGLFTPSTGNTPRIIKTITPLSVEEYNEELIDSIIGQDTFPHDYISELFVEEKENNSLVWYNKGDGNGKLVYLDKRANVVDWICSTGVSFELQRSTIYKTIYYFDKLCSEKDVNLCHLHMIAATCLLIAIKWNEKEERVPSLYRLSKACNKQYTPCSFKPMEVKVLNLLSFRLKIVLPIDFVSFYIDQGCVFNDDTLDGHIDLHLHSQTNIYLEKFAIFFLDIISQNYTFWQFLPSMIAFAVIIASRRALKIKPYFNAKLTNLGNYYPSQIKHCFDRIWKEYHVKYPNDAIKAEIVQPWGLEKYFVQNSHQRQYQARHTF